MLTNAAIIASLLSAVSAHQNFHQFWVNDVSPGVDTSIRMPPSNSPVIDVTSNDITCNVGGNKVPSGVTTAPANEGDTIKVKWDSSSHPGPISHFLFGPVDDASMATGVGSWIKIDEFASENGTWANEIMMAAEMTHTFKLPTGLASGEYLLRSEMLALHGSQTIGGAQFYIGCAQLKITGTGSAGSCTPEIQLPGAYSAEEAGIYIPNVYNGFDISSYVAPGGEVAVCGAGSGSAPVATSAVSTATIVPVPASSAVASASVEPTITSADSVTIPNSLPTSAAAEETSSAAGAVTSPAPVVDVPAVSSTKKSACKAKTSAAVVATSAPFSNSTIPVSTRKSACKAKTTSVPVSTRKSACKAKKTSGAAAITNFAALNAKAIVPKATTFSTATRSTSPTLPVETGSSSGETSTPPAAAGTTLDTLISWISSFYTANKGTSYDANTTV